MGESLKKQIKTELLENNICAAVGRKLQAMYPGWSWLVECEWQSGVVTVKNLNFGSGYGFVLHLQHLVNDIDLKLVTAAGGEILERCGYKASAKPQVVDKQRNFKGEIVGDTHGAE